MKLTARELEFINQNNNADIQHLALHKSKFEQDIRPEIVIHQIATRQKTKNKFPLFHENPKFIFPKKISVEQSSSELTAEYKAQIAKYTNSADLTGGMGIDSIYFSKFAQFHYYNEIDKELCEIFNHNASSLEIGNISISNFDAYEFLNENISKLDLIYLDPARRDSDGNKTYFLDDTAPNPLKIIEIIMKMKGNKPKILIKTSPLLDISKAVSQLNAVSEVHIVSVDNECKELLFLLDFEQLAPIKYNAVDILKGKPVIVEFTGCNLQPSIANPQNFIYEPNTSIMKLGFWNEIGHKFSISQVALNTHLFTSEKYFANFPGRTFKILSIEKIDKKRIHNYLPNKKANISVRNYPMSVTDIRKKMNIADGGDIYIFFVTLHDNSSRAIISKKISSNSIIS